MTNMAIDGGMKQAYVDYAQSVIVSKTYDYEGNPVSFSNNGTIMVQPHRWLNRSVNLWVIGYD